MQIPALLLPAITLVTVNNNHAILGLANPLQYGRLGRFWLREAPSMRQSPYLVRLRTLKGRRFNQAKFLVIFERYLMN